MWEHPEASDLPSSGQSGSAIIHSYLLAKLVPSLFHLFIDRMYRETAVYEDLEASEVISSVAL